MSKAVLISIQPEWCQLIASGKKTIEVRKTKPKLETPFKCYIYETRAKTDRPTMLDFGGILDYHGRGKIIGEFVCEKTTEFYPTTDLKQLNPIHFQMCEKSCVDMRELYAYANSKKLYGLHISDLVIYDKPKELSEFYTECDMGCEDCDYWKSVRVNADEFDMDCDSGMHGHKPIKRAPQSWCYVEEV